MEFFRKTSICKSLRWVGVVAILFVVLAVRGYADEREVARSLLDQLDDRRFSERNAAFLKLCDPRWDIDRWLEEQSRVSDPNRASLLQWIRRVRSIQGSMQERLEMMGDYQSLADGDLSVVNKFINDRKIDALVEILEIVPQASREEMFRYRSAYHPTVIDQAISAAWRDGKENLIPRLLNVVLPRHAIRVGLNARWKELGMPPEWRVDEPLDVPDAQIATHERDGRIDEALAVAKRNGLSERYEALLIRHQRWDAWLELDPLKKTTSATGWGDVQRIMLLECLGRHDEAMVYYDLRKTDKGKTKSYYNQQKATMALFVGDKDAFEQLLKSDSPQGLVDILFLRNDLERLLEIEGLSDLKTESLDKWFDKWVNLVPLANKPIRFQSLFHRLGLDELESHLFRRIRSHIKTDRDEQSLTEWDALLNEWRIYGLDHRRLEVIADLCARREKDRPTNEWILSQRGLQQIQDETRGVTLETLFFKNFPNIRFAAMVLYDVLRKRNPELDPKARIEIVEDLNQGRMPAGWSEKELLSVIRDMIRASLHEPSVLEPMLVDIADTLDTLGMTEEAINILQDHSDSLAARMAIAKYFSELGQIDIAANLSLEIADQYREDVHAHLLASQCLADARRFDDWMNLQKRNLSRMDSWEWLERYLMSERGTQKMEPQPDVLLMLELLRRHSPSTWHELWYGNAYTEFGAWKQADWYHRSVAEHPDRISELRQLAIEKAMDDIQERAKAQFPDQGQGGATGMKDIDWTQWSFRYERIFASCFWHAVQKGKLELADRLIRTAHQVYPEQINTLIDVVPLIRSQFGDETLRKWYELYAGPMRSHLERFPNDTLVANNAAWLAAKCGVELERAHQLAQQVVQQRPTDTYLDTLAEVEFIRGNIDKAIEISEKCHAMKPREQHHIRQLGRFRKPESPSAKQSE
jgi:tetratricopeptide (TPR) repeat protein